MQVQLGQARLAFSHRPLAISRGACVVRHGNIHLGQGLPARTLVTKWNSAVSRLGCDQTNAGAVRAICWRIMAHSSRHGVMPLYEGMNSVAEQEALVNESAMARFFI